MKMNFFQRLIKLKYSFNDIKGHGKYDAQENVLDLAAICDLSAKYNSHSSIPVGVLVANLQMPMKLNQYKVFYNSFGICMGFCTWAFLSPRTEKRLLREKVHVIEFFEWCEGDSLWIMDFLVPRGAVKNVIASFRDELFLTSSTITYFRYKSAGLVFKRVARSDRSYFFSGPVNDPDRLG